MENQRETFNISQSANHSIARSVLTEEDMAVGKNNHLHVVIKRADGTIEDCGVVKNARTDAGAAGIYAALVGTYVAPYTYIGLSGSSLTLTKSDTTLSGEISSGTNSGLARALGSVGSYTAPSSSNGTASYVLSNTFTSSGSTTVASAAIFNASSSGTMLCNVNLSQSYALNTSDQLILSWTVTI